MPRPNERSATTVPSPSRPFYVQIAHHLEDHLDDFSWPHVTFKICAYSYIALIAWITWQVLPLPGHWDLGHQSDKIPTTSRDLNNYFGSFEGFSECGIRALDLYISPPQDDRGKFGHNVFCANRDTLLRAMSNGGRVGFDAPYTSRSCHYRWYSITEICMILERFDKLLFVGDASLQIVYNGFNILLRQDLAHGALQTWAMNDNERIDCQCDRQFSKASCARYYLTASDQIEKSFKGSESHAAYKYVCKRPPHAFLSVNGGEPTQDLIDKFNEMVPKAPRSNYKPIPVIHSLSPMTASHHDAATSLLGYLKLADLSERKTPMLWIGPTAAGHVEIRGRETNQEIWNFDQVMADTARENDVEILKMWNMTVQANSWDGVRFGEAVALVQAMMLINWLGRLESS